MGLVEIRNEIVSLINEIPDIGPVYDYDRYTSNWNKFLDLFTDDQRNIAGWVVSRKSTVSRMITRGEKEKAHVFLIRGYYGLKDSTASEKDFQLKVEAIDAKFDANFDLNGVCDTINPDWGPCANSAGLQIDTVEIREFGSVLCHYTECRLCPVERVEV